MTCICDTPYILAIPDYFTGKLTNASLTIVSSLSHRVLTESIKYNELYLRDSLYLDSQVNQEKDFNIDIILAASHIITWDNIDIDYSKENAIELCRINPLLRKLVIETSTELSVKIQESVKDLIKFASNEFKLSAKDKNGDSLRDTLEKAKLHTGIIADELIKIDVHPSVMYLWHYFLQLSSSRQSGMAVSPLSYFEIESWQRLSRIEISPFELTVIKALDSAFISHINSKDETK